MNENEKSKVTSQIEKVLREAIENIIPATFPDVSGILVSGQDRNNAKNTYEFHK